MADRAVLVWGRRRRDLISVLRAKVPAPLAELQIAESMLALNVIRIPL